jgi:hypothetical protein
MAKKERKERLEANKTEMICDVTVTSEFPIESTQFLGPY